MNFTNHVSFFFLKHRKLKFNNYLTHLQTFNFFYLFQTLEKFPELTLSDFKWCIRIEERIEYGGKERIEITIRDAARIKTVPRLPVGGQLTQYRFSLIAAVLWQVPRAKDKKKEKFSSQYSWPSYIYRIFIYLLFHCLFF